MKNTITDWHGRCTEIKDGETYTVIYSTIGLPFDLMVLNGLYHNYPSDKYIGQDNEGGDGPYNKKIFFDNNVPDEGLAMKIIRRVYTDKEWQEKLNELVD